MADLKILFSKGHLPLANFTWSKFKSFQRWIVKFLFQALARARVRSSSVPATRPRPSAWPLPSSTPAWSCPTGRAAGRRSSPAQGTLLKGLQQAPRQAHKQAQGLPAPRRAVRRKEPSGEDSGGPGEGHGITWGTPNWGARGQITPRAEHHPPPGAWQGPGQQPGTEYLPSSSSPRCLTLSSTQMPQS